LKKDSIMENHQLKAGTEKLLDEALYLMAAQESPPSLWQIAKFLDSIDGCRRGMYRSAWNDSLAVMADNVAEQPFPNPVATAKELAGISLETFGAGLRAIKVLPVFEGPNFGPIEIVSDWVRKQPQRLGIFEPA
jgi:hypothetical protein